MAGVGGWRARVGATGYRVALLALRAWWVVGRTRSSGVRCVLRHGDDIMLVRHSYGDRRWMLPGGRVRRGEDTGATATREMDQELGLACRNWTVTGCNAARTGYRRRSPADAFRRHPTARCARARGRSTRPAGSRARRFRRTAPTGSTKRPRAGGSAERASGPSRDVRHGKGG
jgi:hypothetical protein